MILHGFFRSGASWRVRIALALKKLDAEQVSHHLRKSDQTRPEYLAINPQGLVPAIVLDQGDVLTQSLAILEYFDEVCPEPPILPSDPVQRARVRAAAYVIACDTHPVQNLKILKRVEALAGDDAGQAWARQTVEEGLSAYAKLIENAPGPFSFGESITLADICLIPQLGNARKFGAQWKFGRLEEIERASLAHSAFFETRPEVQPDAE